MKKKRFTGDEVDRMVELRMRRMHPKLIARDVGRTQGAVEKVLSVERKKRGIVYPAFDNRHWTDDKLEQMFKYTQRMTYKAVGDHYGITDSRVTQLMTLRAERIEDGIYEG